MPLVSLEICLLFVLAWAAYHALWPRFGVAILLFASYGIAFSIHPFIPLILGSFTLANYALLRQMLRRPSERLALCVVLVLDLATLAAIGLMAPATPQISSPLGPTLYEYAAPSIAPLWAIGASFYVLQAIEVAVSIRRGTIQRLGVAEFALLLSFFPKLLAGPLVDSSVLIGQIRDKSRRLDINRFQRAIWSIAAGLFMKAAVANRVAGFCDPIFLDPVKYEGVALVLAAYLFPIQFAFEVLGYLSLARGK